MPYKHSEETKEKMRQKAIGRKHSEATKEKLRQQRLGIGLSLQHRQNIKIGLVGRHPWAGRTHTEESKEKNRLAKTTKDALERSRLIKLDNKNPMWLGDKVGYSGIHSWVRRRINKPELCQKCNTRKAYDLANISGEYRRDLSDWWYICRGCHMISDGRMEVFKRHANKPSKDKLTHRMVN